MHPCPHNTYVYVYPPDVQTCPSLPVYKRCTSVLPCRDAAGCRAALPSRPLLGRRAALHARKRLPARTLLPFEHQTSLGRLLQFPK